VAGRVNEDPFCVASDTSEFSATDNPEPGGLPPEAALWLHLQHSPAMRAIVEHNPAAPLDGKVSASTFRQIEAAMDGPLIQAETLPGRNGKRGPTLYTAGKI